MPHDLADLLDAPSLERLGLVKGVTATPVTPLAREWHRKGHAVCVFCLEPSVAVPILLTGDRLSIHVLPKRRFRHSMMDFYGAERQQIAEAVASENPDVISAQWSYEHALGALDTGIPTLVTCHDTPLRYAWIAKNLFMAYHVAVAAVVFRRAKHLIAVSPYTADHIRRWFFLGKAPSVIPNGLPMDIFERGQRRLQKPAGAARPFTISCVGGWGRIKNCTVLLEAFGIIRKEVADAQLVLYGGGLGMGEDAEAWATARGLTAGVVFAGKAPRERILDFLASDVDLMIHPSLVECHPMVLIEAIACGVPVLAGKSCGGVAWTLGEGRYGKLCDVTDPEAIARAALSIISAGNNHKPSPSEAWQAIREENGIDRIAERIAEYLERIREAAC